MKRSVALMVGLSLVLATNAWAADKVRIATPAGDDTYAHLVARAEADDQSVDFGALRHAWLDSAARKHRTSTDALARDMGAGVRANAYAKVRDDARQILTIDYTDMNAHKLLRQSCELLHDDDCATHYHFTEFGLLTSITKAGDGKSYATAWPVISVAEEYFMISMMGAQPGGQALVSQNNKPYDRMDVTDQDGHKTSLLFDISAFFGIHELD